MIARQEQFYRSNRQVSSTASGLEVGDTCVVDNPTGCTIEEGPFVPYHIEEGDFELCWTCHGYLVGPPETRLCGCPRLGSVSSAFAALRDGLAERYRRRWFRVLMPLLDDTDQDEARAVWDGLWTAARDRAARRLAKRGLR